MKLHLKLLVATQLLLVLALGSFWLFTSGTGMRLLRGDGASGRLEGSRPPEGLRMPTLSGVRGIDPPAPRGSAGTVSLVAGSCADCRSGDLLGGALARLQELELPREASLDIYVWGGSAAEWKREWGLRDPVRVHAVDDAAAPVVKRRLRTGESAIAYVGDGEGRWRSTFHLGQLEPADVAHDMRVLSRSGVRD